jgi:hypothetical protein
VAQHRIPQTVASAGAARRQSAERVFLTVFKLS